MNTNKISLGTVQWGTEYGISNSRGQTNPHEVPKILSAARSNGIRHIDTAMTYGNSERVLGKHDLNYFSVVTKIPKFDKEVITKIDAFELLSLFKKSLKRLNSDSCYGLLIHNKEDILKSGGTYIIEVLNIIKSQGLVKKIGVSIYDTNNMEEFLDKLNPDIVQLPLSVFDQRAIQNGSLLQLKKRGIEIHARSLFLQGLLLMPPEKIPSFFEPWSEKLNVWRSACVENNMSCIEAALNFVTKQENIDYCVVGVEDLNQLHQCILASKSNNFFHADDLASTDSQLLNPSNWKI